MKVGCSITIDKELKERFEKDKTINASALINKLLIKHFEEQKQ